MEELKQNKIRDIFINLGATISLYILVGSLVSLLFSVINSAYPQITNGYNYYSSTSISWPVAILVIFFPIFISLMWLLGKEYSNQQNVSQIHKFLTYLTLFIAGLILAGNFITVLYYFIDGQELTTAFLLKVLSLLVITGSVFAYYISDIRGTLTPKSRNMWRIFALVLVLGSIIWGFSVLGSPRTQRLYKEDSRKINDLQMMKSQVEYYYSINSKLPENLDDIKSISYSRSDFLDPQTKTPYGYEKTGDLTYKVCANFNMNSVETRAGMSYPYYEGMWSHPEGYHCFDQKIDTNLYPKPRI